MKDLMTGIIAASCVCNSRALELASIPLGSMVVVACTGIALVTSPPEINGITSVCVLDGPDVTTVVVKIEGPKSFPPRDVVAAAIEDPGVGDDRRPVEVVLLGAVVLPGEVAAFCGVEIDIEE